MITLPIKDYPSKAAFCRAMGVKDQYLTQIEKGIRPIPPKMAVNLNKLHGIPLHEIRPEIYPQEQSQSPAQEQTLVLAGNDLSSAVSQF